MHVVAFAGPSRPDILDPAIDWRPPAGAGDLLAVLAERPDRIVLIDGLFDARPAPWHKEILLLMEHGVAVIGAASMGALRAAELAPYGMIGIGAVYAAYRSGHLTADDEVAVLHAPEALGWQPLTEALVNVRATLLAAVRARIVDPAGARHVLDAARRLNFRKRDWAAILDGALPDLGLASTDRLWGWIDRARVNLKARDAALAIAFARFTPLETAVAWRTPRTPFLRRLADHAGVALPG